MDELDLGSLARAWAVQPAHFAWLLGAGASAAAGIPTANRIVDDLLLRLYSDATGEVRQNLDTTDPDVMARVRGRYDGSNGLPRLGAPDDYSAVFEAAMPTESARTAYLREVLAGRTPCYGQRVLGAAIAAGLTDLVLTTNFDELIERATAEAVSAVPSPARLLSVAALGSGDRAATAFATNTWPLLIKLHGDFRESRLKNLAAELRAQDETLRRAVFDASRRFGLIVVGYSGRDSSVMEMLRAASIEPGAWPSGLWWISRSPGALPPHVGSLLDDAASAGVETHAVNAETFDEVMNALSKQATLPPPLRSFIDGLRPRGIVSDAPWPTGPAPRLPVLRLNAFPVISTPDRVWRVSTDSDLTAQQFKDHLRASFWRGCAVQVSAGEVMALGSASALTASLGTSRPATEAHVDFAAPDMPPHLRALMIEALTRGVKTRLPARAVIHRSGANQLVLLPARDGESRHNQEVREQLQRAYDDDLTGSLPPGLGQTARGVRGFAEGLRLRLEYVHGGWWLLYTPFTWTERSQAMLEASSAGRRPPVDPAADWVRERWAKRRFNEKWAAILAAWANTIAAERPTTEVRAFTGAASDLADDTIAAVFTLGSTTAYSRRAQ